jgi:FtsP/CotA-like multicopper oxidase with cupredoxin domain
MRKLILSLILSLSFLAATSQTTRHFYVQVDMNSKHLFYDGTLGGVWTFGYYDPTDHSTYANSLPGPFLECNVGDSVIVHFWNNAGESHTIHLHGLDVDQANDGVPTTSAAVLGFDSTTYHFKADHAGNYLYHCHIQTSVHLQMGMYGGIRVWDTPNQLYPGGPYFYESSDYIASDSYAYWNENLLLDYFLINGYQNQQTGENQSEVIYVEQDTSYLLNLFNVGYSIVDFIIPQELNATIYTSDGRPLPSSVQSDSIRLYSGERYGVILKPTTNYQGSIKVKYKNTYEDQLYHTNDIWVNLFPSGIEDVVDYDLTIAPNPCDKQFVLSGEFMDSEITVFDINGRIVKQIPISAGQATNTIRTANWTEGVYFIKVGNSLQKIVVQH